MWYIFNLFLNFLLLFYLLIFGVFTKHYLYFILKSQRFKNSKLKSKISKEKINQNNKLILHYILFIYNKLKDNYAIIDLT